MLRVDDWTCTPGSPDPVSVDCRKPEISDLERRAPKRQAPSRGQCPLDDPPSDAGASRRSGLDHERPLAGPRRT